MQDNLLNLKYIINIIITEKINKYILINAGKINLKPKNIIGQVKFNVNWVIKIKMHAFECLVK